MRIVTAGLATIACACLAGAAAARDRTPHESAVWQLEEDYWRFVSAGDVESYVKLWHEDFVGWPCFEWVPARKGGNYLRNPLVNGEVNPTNARYSLAYSELKTRITKRPAGILSRWQEGYVSSASSAIEQDAYLRAADCYFMTSNYKQALRMYEQVLSQRLPGADYALLQKAVIAGASSKNTEKVGLLQSLERQFPGSAYTAEANMEIANTYMADMKISRLHWRR